MGSNQINFAIVHNCVQYFFNLEKRGGSLTLNFDSEDLKARIKGKNLVITYDGSERRAEIPTYVFEHEGREHIVLFDEIEFKPNSHIFLFASQKGGESDADYTDYKNSDPNRGMTLAQYLAPLCSEEASVVFNLSDIPSEYKSTRMRVHILSTYEAFKHFADVLKKAVLDKIKRRPKDTEVEKWDNEAVSKILNSAVSSFAVSGELASEISNRLPDLKLPDGESGEKRREVAKEVQRQYQHTSAVIQESTFKFLDLVGHLIKEARPVDMPVYEWDGAIAESLRSANVCLWKEIAHSYIKRSHRLSRYKDTKKLLLEIGDRDPKFVLGELGDVMGQIPRRILRRRTIKLLDAKIAKKLRKKWERYQRSQIKPAEPEKVEKVVEKAPAQRLPTPSVIQIPPRKVEPQRAPPEPVKVEKPVPVPPKTEPKKSEGPHIAVHGFLELNAVTVDKFVRAIANDKRHYHLYVRDWFKASILLKTLFPAGGTGVEIKGALSRIHVHGLDSIPVNRLRYGQALVFSASRSPDELLERRLELAARRHLSRQP